MKTIYEEALELMVEQHTLPTAVARSEYLVPGEREKIREALRLAIGQAKVAEEAQRVAKVQNLAIEQLTEAVRDQENQLGAERRRAADVENREKRLREQLATTEKVNAAAVLEVTRELAECQRKLIKALEAVKVPVVLNEPADLCILNKEQKEALRPLLGMVHRNAFNGELLIKPAMHWGISRWNGVLSRLYCAFSRHVKEG